MTSSSLYPKRGDIYFVNLKSFGSVQGGCRPAIIVQNDVGNMHSSTTQVVPLSSKVKALHLPTHTVIKATAESGLKVNSVAMAEQMTTVDKSQLLSKIGNIKVDKKIEDAILASVAIAV